MAELSNGPVSREETREIVAVCTMLARIMVMDPDLVRLETLIRQQRRAEGVGPLIDPTAWLTADPTQEVGMKLLLAVYDFRTAMLALKDDAEAVRAVEEAPGVPS